MNASTIHHQAPPTQPWIEGRMEESLITTTVEQAINWARQASIWPMTFGLACCAIEMMAAGASLCQIYTGFIYQGPQLIADLVRACDGRI